MNIAEIRKSYPQYNDLTDVQLATSLHRKFYSDIPFEDFSQRTGLAQQTFTGQIPEGMDVRDFDINAFAKPPGFQPEASQGPKTFKERLFGKEGTQLMPGAEPIKFAFENPDIVGATAASLAAPQLALPAAVSRMGKLAAPLLSRAPQIGAAAAGGGVGGAARETLNNPEATLDSIIEQGVRSSAEMATAEVAGIGAAGLLTKTLAPGTKSLTAEGKKLIDFARQHNIPLKPSAAAPSWTAKGVEGTVESFIPGRVVKQFANKKIANVLATNTADANKLIDDVAKVYNKNSPGLDRTIRSSKRAIETGLENWTPKVEAKYAKFTESIGGRDRWTPYPKLRGVMETIVDEQKALAGGSDEAIVSFIKAFRKKYSGEISADDLYKQYKRLGHIKGADKRHLGLIRDAFKEEFGDLAAQTGDDAISILKDANKEYILGKRYFKNDPTIKKIIAGNIDDARVTVELFRDSKYSTLRQLEANIPKENFLNLQRLNLENLIQNSSVRPQDNPFVSVLDGNKLLRWIEKNPKTMGLYPKETQEALRNLALYAKFHGKEALAGTKGIGGAIEGAALRTSLTGGGMFATTGAPGLLVSSAAAAPLAYSMMRPSSVINKWLVRGEIGPFAQGINEGLRVGGRLVFQDSTSQSATNR